VKIARDKAHFREFTQNLANSYGQAEANLKDESNIAGVEKLFDELAEMARDFSPRDEHFTFRTVDPSDSKVDPREMRAELQGKLRFALQSLDEIAKVLPARRAAIAKLVLEK
jgi:hypothetical protein